MRKLFTLISLLCVVHSIQAQLNTYVTLEAGPQWSLVRVADIGGYFESANVKSSIAGLTVGQEVLPNLSVITGIYYQQYVDGINLIDKRREQSRWTNYTALLIPIRGEYRVQFTELPVSITPRLGYVLGIISTPESPYNATGIISAPDGSILDYNLAYSYEPVNLHMLEVGLGINLRFSGIWQASVNLSYLNGFTEPVSNTVSYSASGSPIKTATYSTKGNTVFSSLAFSVPVSNIWQNKDYRIRARIENSVSDGKPVEKRGQFYVGAELGALWRRFNITNPAITARPMTGRGIFRYSNLHTGAYFGYMLSEELGIDLGLTYQRSSTFYALMYDHEVDYSIKTKAPFFLEIPVRIRYFYNVYKHKVHYVVYGGASLLTHFSSAGYNMGGGDFTYNSSPLGTPVNATTSFIASRTSRLSPVLRLGTGVEYNLPIEFPMIATLYVNYMHGFISNDMISVSNTLTEVPSESGVSYKGSGWSLDIGVKIPFRWGEWGKNSELPQRE